ncbi:hypothetical protein ABVT39_026259 [Epinephelus coioides]
MEEEEELLEELDKEERLSQLFSRKSSTQQQRKMYNSPFHPCTEIFGGIQITNSLLSAEDAKPAELLELEQSTGTKPGGHRSQFGKVCQILLLCVCTTTARFMVKAIYERFDKHFKSFRLKDHDESCYTATEAVISAIKDMDCEMQSDASSLDHLQLEEELLEERESSPQVTVDEEMATVQNDVVVSMDDELEEVQQEEVKGVLPLFLEDDDILPFCFY